MSNSDRGPKGRTWIIVWGLVALAFITGILLWAIPTHLSYSDQATRSAEHHSRYADSQVRRSCVNLTPAAFEQCIEETRGPAEERQRAERDLEAQRKMALWTAIMGAMAVIGVGLSGFGVYLIWRTWDATREAAENSRKTFRAYVAVERPRLAIGKSAKSGGFLTDEGELTFELDVANMGKTVAYAELIYFWVDERIPDVTGDDAFNVQRLDQVIGDGTTATLPFKLVEVPNRAFIGGYATYESGLDESHVSYFLFEVTKVPPGEFFSVTNYRMEPVTFPDDWPDNT